MKNITIYSTPSCVYCKMAKAFLKSKDIPFEEKDVLADLTAREEMVKKSGQLGVPVIVIDNDTVVGFNKTTIAEMLGIAA